MTSAGPHRVVFAHDANEFGGMELYMLRLMRGLDRERYEPFLLIPGYQDKDRSSPTQLVAQALGSGIPVLRTSDPGGVPIASSTRELFHTVGLLSAQRTDIVHIHTCRPDGARKVTLASRMAGVRGVVRSEHMPPEVFMTSKSRYLVKPFDRLTDIIVTGSDGDHRAQIALLDRSPHRLVRIHNGVEVDRIAPIENVIAAKVALGLDPSLPTVGTVGRLVEQKGHRYLIEAVALASQRVGPINLLVAGEGPLRGELESQARRLGISDHVRFLGHVDDVVPIIHATDVAAMPSLWEVLSLSLLEFMAAGSAIIASTHSSFQEALVEGESGLLVPTERTGDWADAIVQLLHDPVRRSRLGLAARERVRTQFNLSRLVDEMMAVYDRVLSDRHPSSIGHGSLRRERLTSVGSRPAT